MLDRIVSWAKSRPGGEGIDSTSTGFRQSISGRFGSSLPADADEIIELNKSVSSTCEHYLNAMGTAIAKVELRRRLSNRTYRLYVTLSKTIEIHKLFEVEIAIRNKVNKTEKIEIVDFFWRYKPAEERVVHA